MMTFEKLTGWRKKDRYRFRNSDLLAIRYHTGCREVYDIHEAICDLIDEERANRVKVSPLTLCTIIHDHPQGDDWSTARVAVVEALRERELICFEGDVTLTGELEISLPDRVYARWHEDGAKAAANARPRDPKTGRLLPKTPASTPTIPAGDSGAPSGSPMVPSEREGKGEGETEGNNHHSTTHRPSRAPAHEANPTDRGGGGPIDELSAEVKRATLGRIHTQLERILLDPNQATSLVSQIGVKARNAILVARGSQRRQVYNLQVWERAVNVLVRQITEERREITGDIMGLLITMVPSYEHPGSDTPVQVRRITPAADTRKVETAAEIQARMAREADAAAGMAS